MALTINDVKLALRVGHSQLDEQFTDDIASAKAYMKNLGILSTKVEATSDSLIDHAILAYCKWQECEDMSDREGYEMEFKQWVDEIRKTPEYYMEASNV